MDRDSLSVKPKTIFGAKEKKIKIQKSQIKACKVPSKNVNIVNVQTSVTDLLKLCRPITIRLTSCNFVDISSKRSE